MDEKLKRVADDVEGHIFFHHKHALHNIYLGIHVVFFGYRVVVHQNDGEWIPISFCGGGNQDNVADLFSVMHKIVSDWDNPRCPDIYDFPPERRRPWGNDPDFQKGLREMAGEYPQIELPPLYIYRSLHHALLNAQGDGR